jgi:hypothetical protein
MIAPTPSFRLIYHFPNPFPEITWLQETVPKTSAGQQNGPYKGNINLSPQAGNEIAREKNSRDPPWLQILPSGRFEFRTTFWNYEYFR